MVALEDLYIMDVTEFTNDFFRMGNGSGFGYKEDRARIDLVVVIKNGVETVLDNGNGFSAFDHLTSIMRRKGKKVWKIKKNASLPPEIRLVKDLRKGHEGHYMLAPAKPMSLKKYLGI